MTAAAPRISAWVGSAILAATAAFHSTGLPGAREAATACPEGSLCAVALVPLWVTPSIHWIGLAVLVSILAVSHHWPARAAIFVAALVVIIDAVMITAYIGFFTGVAMLAASALCFILAALLTRGSP